MPKKTRRKNRLLLIILIIALLLAILLLFKLCSRDDSEQASNSSNYSSRVVDDTSSQSQSPLDLNSLDEDSDKQSNSELITIQSGLDEGDLLLINGSCKVPEQYKSEDLPCIYEKNTAYLVRSTEMYIQQQALDSMKIMFEAAKNDGIENMLIVDTYRTQDKQQSLFDKKVAAFVKEGLSKEEANKKTADTVAVPGYSEHQVGLAMDIDLHDTEYTNFEKTDFAKWMAKNSWKYGWILRYSADKVEITDIAYEPWHFRYVGICHAQYMYENNLCLEEYILELHEKGKIEIDSIDNKYEVIYAKADENGRAEVEIPKGSQYTVSGDNMGGFIVSVSMEPSAPLH